MCRRRPDGPDGCTCGCADRGQNHEQQRQSGQQGSIRSIRRTARPASSPRDPPGSAETRGYASRIVPEGTRLDDVEIVASGPRYVFGVSPAGWGVWDRLRPDAPMALFSGSDEGMIQAEKLYDGLDREDRRARGVWSKPLLIVLFVALGVWVVTRAVDAALFSFLYLGHPPGSGLVRAAQITDAVAGVSFALWLAALVLFVALWLQRNRLAVDRLTAPVGLPGGEPPAPIDSSGGGEPPATSGPSQWARPAPETP